MAGGRRRNGTVLIVIALLIIVALAAVYFLVLRPQQQAQQAQPLPSQAAPVEQTVPVVITTQHIGRGAVITKDVLTTVDLPVSKVPEGLYFKDVNEVIGMRTKYDMDAQMFVTKSLVTESVPGSRTAFQIDPGKAAVSIPINAATAVNFAPQAGDHVMVIACFLFLDLDQNFQTRLPNFTSSVLAPGPGQNGTTASTTVTSGGALSSQGRFELDTSFNQPVYVTGSEAQRPRLVCQTVIQDAAVLRLGKFPINAADTSIESSQPTPTPTPNPNGEAAAPVVEPASMTLVVSPQDAVMLYYLMQTGANLNMALRGAGDTQQIVTEPVTMQFVMDQKNVPLPAKLPYGLEPRINNLQNQANGSAGSSASNAVAQPQP
jgi:Flp pilus assembly protein CpaB